MAARERLPIIVSSAVEEKRVPYASARARQVPARASADGAGRRPATRRRLEPSSPSHRAITAVARQLPTRFTIVRAMSISSSTPRITATPSSGRPNAVSVAGEDHQRRPRHRGDAFAGDQQRQHHHQLLAHA